MKLGLPLATREKELADLKPAPGNRTYDVRFQGKLRSFPIHIVRVELPKYRLENGRTSAAQKDYIAENKVAQNFFDPSRSENAEVQKAQHAILNRMASSGDPEKDLFKFFAKRDQEQPLILDCFGFVVNGNRRLCTFREIHEKDNSRFSHIEIIVLPKCDAKDIDELEAHLQVEPDIKQDYSWISLALTLRQRIDSGKYTDEELSDRFDLPKKDIQALITQLTLAEEYLASRNKVGRYLELEKTQFAFQELNKNRAKLSSSPGKQQLYSEIAFRLMDTDAKGDRAYRLIPDAREVVDDIANSLNRELLGKEIAKQKKKIEAASSSDLFGHSQSDGSEAEYTATYQALRASQSEKEITAIIQNAIEAKRQRDQAAKRGNSALEAIRKANTSLGDALSLLSAQSTKAGIEQQLTAIEGNIAKIRQWLKKNA